MKLMMNPQEIVELATLLRCNGDKILNSEFTFTLTGSLLNALNDSFTLIIDSLDNKEDYIRNNFQVLKTINAKSPVFRHLQLIYDFVQKTPLLCLIHYPTENYYDGIIDISKFRTLRRLEIHKLNIHQVVGIQPLRSQLRQLICIKSLQTVDDIITKCGGDNSNGFVWNELTVADFSYNNLKQVDTSLEFAQYLQHLNLRHNQLQSVTAIKWLPHLKTLDLSFNRLVAIPQFHMDTCKRLQSLNMSNNLLEDLMGVIKLEALKDLDISDNCLLEHSYLLPISMLMSLQKLNLYGNPLSCHPKHRLATAQYLNQRCVYFNFTLDFEPLTKKEKDLVGKQKLKQIGALNRYTTRSTTSSSSALSTPGRLTPSNNQTPSSSLGSIKSFLHLNVSDNSVSTINSGVNTDTRSTVKMFKRRSQKIRNVEIQDNIDTKTIIKTAVNNDTLFERHVGTKGVENNLDNSNETQEKDKLQDHLEMKRHVETLRKKYGNEWLQEDKQETLKQVLGFGINSNESTECSKSRQLFHEYLDFTPQHKTENSIYIKEETARSEIISTISKNNTSASIDNQDGNNTLYESAEQSVINKSESSEYQSLENSQNQNSQHDINNKNGALKNENVLDLNYIYRQDNNNSMELSETEEDEETYIVYSKNKKEPIFLTKSSNYLREKDPLTKRTKYKWSLKILESCDRIEANVLRINFDTVKLDKKERVYTVAEDLCLELEMKLRDILSQRNLIDMNQTIYCCINCNCQFSQENHQYYKEKETHCPNCNSVFVAEVHDLSKSLEEKCTRDENKLSTNLIVQEVPNTIMPITMEQSIEMTTTTTENAIISENPLNKSSCTSTPSTSSSSPSCTKVSPNNSREENSITPDESLMENAGTNPRMSNESDIDIISSQSQSSVEVLPNQNSDSRKSSEERTIDDDESAQKIQNSQNLLAVNKNTDALCNGNVSINEVIGIEDIDHGIKKLENNSFSSMLGGLVQSTNILMSSTKKLIESESKTEARTKYSSNSINIYTQPYKYNYNQLHDIDHRLKFHFYQTLFKERDEHIKWLIKGHLYNLQTSNDCDGLIVISTCKCYIMEAFSNENDDVSKWLKTLFTCTIDRLEKIQVLPWKLGVSIKLRDWGSILLLLKDILRTDSIILYFTNNNLPEQCDILYQPSDVVVNRLMSIVKDNQLEMFCLLNNCTITCGGAKRSFKLCGLIITDVHLYIISGKIDWLSNNIQEETDIEVCVTQFMTNLVETEPNLNERKITISFLDEIVNKKEQWCCTFETADNATCCLNAIGQPWEKLFGVPLINS